MNPLARLQAANNASTKLSADATSTDTSISVLDETVFPSTPFRVTIEGDDGSIEIVEVGAVSTGSLDSLTRGVENTSAQSWVSGDEIEQRLTAGLYDNLVGAQSFDGHDNTYHSETYALQSNLFSGSYTDLTNVPTTFTPENHAIAGTRHDSSTLADLNSLVSDATLDDSSSTRPPETHGDPSHEYTLQINGTTVTSDDTINFQT